jgi:hypothetical protein
MNPSELWQCPKCGRPFANRNQPHSCGAYSVEQFLSGKNGHAIALYTRFAELVNACGPVIMAPAKTRIGFQVKMIFAAINRLTDQTLEAHVILARRYEHPRFNRIESLSAKNHVHHFRVHTVAELDDDVASWLAEAYLVGQQEHLRK